MVPRLDADALVDDAGATTTRSASSRTATSSRENARRGQDDREYELVDTGVFDEDRYWAVDRRLREGRADDLLMRITVDEPRAGGGHDARPAARCGSATPGPWETARAHRRRRSAAVDGRLVAAARPTRDAHPWPATASRCRCSATTRRTPSACTASPAGRPTRRTASTTTSSPALPTVNPDQVGHQGGAALTSSTVPAGGTARSGSVSVPATWRRARLGDRRSPRSSRTAQAEADAFFADLTPAASQRRRGVSAAPGHRRPDVGQAVLPLRRRALAGRRPGWSAAAGGAPARPQRASGATSTTLDVISMPDPWEYPWYAAWDLAFHCVPIAHVDAAFAKGQLILMLREWYMHPNGQIPAYEWAFGDVNPPGARLGGAAGVRDRRGRDSDYEFLGRVFTSCCSTSPGGSTARTPAGNNVFEGGFLGLDNIGPIDRSADAAGRRPPRAERRHGLDGDVRLNLLEMALVLAEHDRATRTWRRSSSSTSRTSPTPCACKGCGTRRTGSSTTCSASPTGRASRCGCGRWSGCCRCARRRRSVSATLERLPDFAGRCAGSSTTSREYRGVVGETHVRDGAEGRLLSVVDAERLVRDPGADAVRGRVPVALRAARAVAAARGPAVLDRPRRGVVHRRLRAGRVDHRACSAATRTGAGRSGSRSTSSSIEAIRRFARFYGDDLLVEHPAGSGAEDDLGRGR